jgi:hypothetical protein
MKETRIEPVICDDPGRVSALTVGRSLMVVLALAAAACASDSAGADATDGDQTEETSHADPPGAPTAETPSTDADAVTPPASSVDSDPTANGSEPQEPYDALGSGGAGAGGSGSLGSGGAATEASDAGRSDHGSVKDAGAANDAAAGGGGGGEADMPFDAGDAECCIPPEPQPSGPSCTEAGGVCTSIGGCLQSGGYSTPPEISCEGGVGITCCVPGDLCGEVDIECCSDGTTFRPACDGGEFVCVAGEPHPLGSCP